MTGVSASRRAALQLRELDIMHSFNKVLAVVALVSVTTFASTAHAGYPGYRRQIRQQRHAQRYNRPVYATTGYSSPYEQRPSAGNPFPQSQVYGNVYGLGGTGYRRYGQVYSGYNSGAGYGYGFPNR